TLPRGSGPMNPRERSTGYTTVWQPSSLHPDQRATSIPGPGRYQPAPVGGVALSEIGRALGVPRARTRVGEARLVAASGLSGAVWRFKARYPSPRSGPSAPRGSTGTVTQGPSRGTSGRGRPPVRTGRGGGFRAGQLPWGLPPRRGRPAVCG